MTVLAKKPGPEALTAAVHLQLAVLEIFLPLVTKRCFWRNAVCIHVRDLVKSMKCSNSRGLCWSKIAQPLSIVGGVRQNKAFCSTFGSFAAISSPNNFFLKRFKSKEQHWEAQKWPHSRLITYTHLKL